MATDTPTAKFNALATLTGVRTDIVDMEWRWLYSQVTPFKGTLDDMLNEFYRLNGYTDRKAFLTFVNGSFIDMPTSDNIYWVNGGGTGSVSSSIGQSIGLLLTLTKAA